ncbi:MAG TPA: MFS transporter [Caulobacteraceae bacterium]|jgi:MFS family permease
MAGATGARDAGAGQVYFYFASLTLLTALVSPTDYLIDISTTYMLKNQLHAGAIQVSTFRLLTAIPIYFAFIFGLIRDLWNPLGRRDRGFLMIFAPITAMIFVVLAFSKLSYLGLVAGMLLVMVSSRFVNAAYWGLLALVGQEKLMAGRLSVLWNIISSLPAIAGAAASGFIADHLRPSQTFVLVAVFTLGIGLLGLWKPPAVFNHAYEAPQAKGAGLWGDVKRLLKHRAVYPAVLMIFMFQFSPGSYTPLQYYLSNTLHAPDEIYGLYQAIFAASFLPIFFLYGWLCKRVSLEKLLWWGLIITVPQMIPLALIHSGTQALIMAVPIGMIGGIAAAAIYDLAIRSCPPGLQGTMMTLITAGNVLSSRGSDLLGSKIYASDPHLGFVYCVAATTVVYALIVPVILLVPKHVMNTTDGQASPKLEAEVLAEVAEAEPAGG